MVRSALKIALFLTLVAALFAGGAAAARCDADKAVWSSRWLESDGEPYWVLHFPDGHHLPDGHHSSRTKVRFEKWRGEDMLGSTTADIRCVPAVQSCHLEFRVNGLEFNMVPEGARLRVALIETDEDGDGTSDWMIFVRAPQSAWWGGGIRMNWRPGHAPPADEIPALLPESFAKTGCR